MSITQRRRLQIFSKHIPFTVSILRPHLAWTTANRTNSECRLAFTRPKWERTEFVDGHLERPDLSYAQVRKARISTARSFKA
jgi:hypothetical protein